MRSISLSLVCSILSLACGGGTATRGVSSVLQVNPSALRFETVGAGESREMTVSLRNVGVADFTLSDVSIADDNRQTFRLVSVGQIQLGPTPEPWTLMLETGDSVQVTIAYRGASATGVDTAFLEVDDERLVALTGDTLVAPPKVDVNPEKPTEKPEVPSLEIREGVVSLATGTKEACAVIKTGEVYCFKAMTQAATPIDGITDAVQVDVDFAHACALSATGAVFCWGSNKEGQLGVGSVGESTSTQTPMPVNGLTEAAEIAVSASHSCARLRVTGEVRCWGSNEHAAVGQPKSLKPTPLPTAVAGLPGPATRISVGDFHSCALVGGTPYCWGTQAVGSLGNGSAELTNSPTPTEVSNISDAVEISTDYRTTCVRRAAGQVSCWGDNTSGQYGDGTKTGSGVPRATLPKVVDVRAGAFHSCGVIQQDGKNQAQCWGDNALDKAGPAGADPTSVAPRSIPGMTDVVSVHPGTGHYSCALKAEQGKGKVYCWGNSPFGVFGSEKMPQPLPTAIPGLP